MVIKRGGGVVEENGGRDTGNVVMKIRGCPLGWSCQYINEATELFKDG